MVVIKALSIDEETGYVQSRCVVRGGSNVLFCALDIGVAAQMSRNVFKSLYYSAAVINRAPTIE